MTSTPAPNSPSVSPADAAPSVLQKRVLLSELIDAQSFTDIIAAFSELYRVGVKVFDEAGNKLVDIRVGNSQFCGYLWDFGPSRQACTRLVMGLKGDPFPAKDGVEVARLVQCFTGLRYMVMPLVYEGDTIGRLIFGPYAPQGATVPVEDLYRIEPRIDRQRASELVTQVRPAPDDLVSRLLVQMQRMVDVVVFTSYKAHLASQMHIESVTASYAELQEKNRILQENNDRLQELDKLKSNFLATISHELRTPLTSVIGYSEMMLEGVTGALNDEQREFIKTIMDKGSSLLGLISQILDLSRIESGALRMQVSEYSLKDVLRTATTSVVPQCQKKSLRLQVDVADNLPLLQGDPEKIGQVVVNLLGNALKFTPVGGSITLRAQRFTRPIAAGSAAQGLPSVFDPTDEEFVRIDVIDTGVGIPSDKIGHIFERFFQVDSSSTREFGGTGLGLSIVKSLVEAHRGEIFVESTVGHGSTFTVLLPLG